MIQDQKFASLIQDMTSDQVVALIHEKIALGYGHLKGKEISNVIAQDILKLDPGGLKHPIHILYAIDPYDIIGYSFPFGFRIQNKLDGAELDRQSDRLTAWDTFFRNSGKIFLMNEHRPELARLRNRLVMELQTQIGEFDEFEHLVKRIYTFKSKKQLSRKDVMTLKTEIFQKRLPWLVAAATGELYNSPQRFSQLLGKLVLNSNNIPAAMAAPWLDKSQKEEHVEQIENVFQNTPASKKAFDEFTGKLDVLKNRNIEVDERRQENLLVDYKVTDRILRINEKFEELESKLKCRYILLYLSSDRKSQYTSRDIQSQCPPLLGEPFNLIRNVSQLWLYELMTVEKDGEDRKDESAADAWVKLLRHLTIAHQIVLKRDSVERGEVGQRIATLRNRLEWHGLIKNISAYPAGLKTTFEDLEFRAKFDPLKQAFRELIQTLDKTSGKQRLLSFEQEIRNYNIEVTLLQKIVAVLNTNPTPKISSLGHVVGINHHLPTLFVKTVPISKYEELMDRTVQFIISPSKAVQFGKNLKSLVQELQTMLLTDDIPDIQQGVNMDDQEKEIRHYERQTLLYFVALLLPAENLPKDADDNQESEGKSYNLDSQLDEPLRFDIDTLQARIGKTKNTRKEQLHLKLTISVKNLLYIRLWSLRRNNRLQECEDFIEQQKTAGLGFTEELDIRVKHGKSLVTYSRLLESMEQKHINCLEFFEADPHLKKYWKMTQRDVEGALIAFENRKNEEFDKVPFDKAHSAVLNTLIYVYVLGYAMSKDTKRLFFARKMLDEKMALFEEDRRGNPEYMHTEAYLEYMEALYYRASDPEKAKMKIACAAEAITNCIKINIQYFPYKKKDPDYVNLDAAIKEFG